MGRLNFSYGRLSLNPFALSPQGGPFYSCKTRTAGMISITSPLAEPPSTRSQCEQRGFRG
ncbi:hypothetical protein ACCAA_890029 [Candidatus Accumulibacter aalborgensis]|uniref:Uncharacterized protein n=1 Tax=Candidatus Accumulibacter aalborgensis TaxID=1860102 RepID=A0A1A8XZK0_9PROT|nr:hypothetical protein ACCAA_890029 [Candidatus Accumulibacter aalborgensis]